ncbi:MAG: lipocalin family protein [Blastocatellia bacterium]
MRHKIIFLAAIVGISVLAKTATAVVAQARPQTLTTVPSVDLKRYVGVWYEIARLPNRFEKDCAANITATYTRRNDGKIEVVNQCRKSNNVMKRSKGTARVVDNSGNAKLKVTFFWPFSGDYWVLELGENYEYAVVGEPSRSYLWILSRTPQMDEGLYQQLLSRSSARGFDTKSIIRTPQGQP